MGFLDWIKGAAQTVGNAVGKGLDWVGKKVTGPAVDFLRKVPIVGNVVNAAQPILDTIGKVPGALQGKESIGLKDIARSVAAVPGTILAAKDAATGGIGGLAKRVALQAVSG